MHDQRQDITAWLDAQAPQGGHHAPAIGNELFAWLYNDLLRVARKHMRKEYPGHTLSSGAPCQGAVFQRVQYPPGNFRSGR